MYDDYYSFMDVHQCLHRFGGLGANFIPALDLINAYWQLALHKSSQEYTAFTVPGRGNFVWTVWSAIHLSYRRIPRTGLWGSASPISKWKKSCDCLFFPGTESP